MEERLTVDDVKGDILDAFDMLKERAGRGAALEEANNSETRVLTFLVQCEADRDQLKLAKVACALLLGAKTPQEVDDARALAAGVIEGTPMTEAIRKWEGLV